MEKLKLSIHPLFFAFGFYYALTGRILTFLVYTLTALMHETGHSIMAESCGYRLKKITLMPFGAVADCGGEMSCKDQLKIALAGPFLNLAVGILFVAVWWIFPECYAYTDIAAEANFSLCFVNLLPAYPLDGGRVLCSLISLKLGKERATKICKIIGIVFSLLLISLFIATLFFTPNLSLLLFALFLFFGAVCKSKDCVYVKLKTIFSKSNLKRGVPYKKIAVDKEMTIQKLIKILDKEAVNEVVVFNGEEKIATISQKRLNEIIEKGNIYLPLSNFLA